MDLVVDTCVIVAAFNLSETHHQASADFVQAAESRGDQLIVPTALLWELGATVLRQQMTTSIRANSRLQVTFVYVPVTWQLWQETWDPNKMVQIKGGDRIFVSLALKYKATLVTWDRDLLKKAPEFGINTITPSDYLGHQ